MLQLQLGEAGLLQGLPALSGQVASIKQKVPDGIQDLLPEVIPGGRLICYMLHEIKSSSRPQHSTHFLEDLFLVLHRAEHQGADHHIYGACGHLVHVLPGSHYEAFKLQVSVLGNALDQELLKAGVGINTGHLASRGVELEVGPCATAQLQQGELPRGASELPQVAEELLLLALHLFVVHHSEPRQEVGEPLFAYPVPQAQKVQQVHGNRR